MHKTATIAALFLTGALLAPVLALADQTITAAGSKYTSICPPPARNEAGKIWGSTVAKTL